MSTKQWIFYVYLRSANYRRFKYELRGNNAAHAVHRAVEIAMARVPGLTPASLELIELKRLRPVPRNRHAEAAAQALRAARVACALNSFPTIGLAIPGAP